MAFVRCFGGQARDLVARPALHQRDDEPRRLQGPAEHDDRDHSSPDFPDHQTDETPGEQSTDRADARQCRILDRHKTY